MALFRPFSGLLSNKNVNMCYLNFFSYRVGLLFSLSVMHFCHVSLKLDMVLNNIDLKSKFKQIQMRCSCASFKKEKRNVKCINEVG